MVLTSTLALIQYPTGPTVSSMVLWLNCPLLGVLPSAPVFLAEMVSAALLTRAMFRRVERARRRKAVETAR